MNIGDTVIINEVSYGEPKHYKVVAVQPKPGPMGPIYLIESSDGERLARYSNQIIKVN